MDQLKVGALVAVFIAYGHFVTGLNVSNKPDNDTVEVTSRSSRTEYPVYSPPDTYAPKKKPVPLSYPSTFSAEKDDGPTNFPAETYSESSEEISFQPSQFPSAYYKSKPRYFSQESNFQKSGTNTNWNVWKDATEVPKPPSMKAPPPPPPPHDFEEYYLPADPWKGDPWTPDKMATMMMMMNQMKPKQSLLSGIFKDPLAVLMVAILPISLILAAVLPTLANMMMNGGIPTITTTATGGKARGLEDLLSSPVVKAISTFGARALDNPECMQRVFCQMTNDGDSSASSFRKAMHRMLRFVGEEHLEQFGVKDLVDSMLDGNCEKIPCLNFSSNDSPSENSKEVLKNIM